MRMIMAATRPVLVGRLGRRRRGGTAAAAATGKRRPCQSQFHWHTTGRSYAAREDKDCGVAMALVSFFINHVPSYVPTCS